MTRRVIQKKYSPSHTNVIVDPDRAFPVKVNYSNLQHHGSAANYQMNLNELVSLRSQVPVKSGVYTTQGLNQFNLTQSGGSIIGDIGNYGRRGVKFLRNKAGDALQYGANHGIDYAANYGKRRVGDVAKRVRGDGFFRKVLSGGVRGIANIAADAIGGGVMEGPRPANIRPRRRPAKGLVYTPEQEMAVMSAQNGHGIGTFFRKVAASGVRGIGNIAAEAIGGNVKPKRRRRKGAGIVAPGMAY